MANVVVVGAQWGDEGKGKIVDLLASRADMVVRYGGGNNAGHTVVAEGKRYALHLVPSGILYPGTVCVVGNGVVVDPRALLEEMGVLASQGIRLDGLRISALAHVIMPYHRMRDGAEERGRTNRLGTTGRGIGPAYADKAARTGFRLGDLGHAESFQRRLAEVLEVENRALKEVWGLSPLEPEAVAREYLAYGERLAPYLADTPLLVHEAIQAGKVVLFEGAQGTLLDLDLGTYPYVTSSHPTAGGVSPGAGVGPHALDRVLGVAKAYCTRVGAGPFPTELSDGLGDALRERGHEFGTTTGRPRRCGWFDAVAMRYAVRTNGLDSLAITKLDVLDGLDEVKIAVAYRCRGERLDEFPCRLETLEACEPVYETLSGWTASTRESRRWEDLPEHARAFLDRLAELTGVPIAMVSVGSGRDETLIREDLLAGPRRVLAGR